MVHRRYNFSAGPSALPTEVLQQAQNDLLDWQGRGVSVMEISHRSDAFMQVLDEARNDLKKLLALPENYHVLFLQGGASAQFAAVPMNLLRRSAKNVADYMVSGVWSEKAIKEAMHFGLINQVLPGDYREYQRIPPAKDWCMATQSAYLHYCHNETISGLMFQHIPDIADVPLVADLSSIILAQNFPVSRFGLIYAGSQKNIGPAGMTLVIIREDLCGFAMQETPDILNYQKQAEQGSMLNTPPTFTIYLAGLVFKWLIAQGGVCAMESINRQKSELLYQYIDQSHLYTNQINPDYRSITNVTFHLNQPEYEAKFLALAQKQDLLHLKGHKKYGGVRASMYNAMPLEGAKRLVAFMQWFEQYGYAA